MRLYFMFCTLFFLQACNSQSQVQQVPKDNKMPSSSEKADWTPIEKTAEEWKALLTPQAYTVLREQGTERAFSGTLLKEKRKGIFTCGGCALPLFDASTKFESGTGWPSFYEPINETNVGETSDTAYGMVRVEVHCNRCGGHLGHVFEDGPAPTGLRYCINSVSLGFEPSQP